MRKTSIVALLAVLACPVAGQLPGTRGHLIIVGGGPRSPEVMNTFLQLGGGPEKALVLVLPMAAANAEAAGRSGVADFERMGYRARFAVIDRAAAESDTIERVFRGVTAVWFPGGVQSRITTAMAGTAAERALHAAYRGGAVIGGTSAGAAIMSSIMITGSEKRPGGARPDSTQDFITIDRDNVVTIAGLGLLPNAIVDQHFLRRKRHNRLMSLAMEYPDKVAIGIDESTALHVPPTGAWRVLGNSSVVIYDARKARTSTSTAALNATGITVHVLSSGGEFDPSEGARLPAKR